MDDTTRKPVAVLNKQGQQEVDSRGKTVVRQGNVDQVEAEDEVDRYKKQLGSSREAWPGEHASNIKRLQGEENERRKKAGLPEKYPSASPSPSPSATATPDMPRKPGI